MMMIITKINIYKIRLILIFGRVLNKGNLNQQKKRVKKYI